MVDFDRKYLKVPIPHFSEKLWLKLFLDGGGHHPLFLVVYHNYYDGIQGNMVNLRCMCVCADLGAPACLCRLAALHYTSYQQPTAVDGCWRDQKNISAPAEKGQKNCLWRKGWIFSATLEILFRPFWPFSRPRIENRAKKGPKTGPFWFILGLHVKNQFWFLFQTP